MKKNGFVSTSLIYTFFFIFLLLMLFLLNSYSRIRFLLEDYKYDIKESFANLSVADINVYFMVWDNTTEEYELTKNMPSFGYIYEPEISYCKNNSVITYNGGSVSITASRKDSCYVYFTTGEKDIVLNIYTKTSADGERKLVQEVPGISYNFTGYSCTNGAELEFDDETRQFKITSAYKTVCDVEFTRKDMDIILNIYKEDANGEHECSISSCSGLMFKEVTDIPGENYKFTSYYCENENAVINENENGVLSVEAKGKDVCNIYYTGGNDKIEIIIMQEAENGVDGYTTGKKYSRVYQPPTTGYAYIGYICDDKNAKITYDKTSNTLVGEGTTQTVCRAYFNKFNTEKALINYYLETTSGNYESVVSVPELGYIFSHGNCEYGSAYKINNNYVEVSATNSNEVCNFYFKQANADIKVLVYVMNRNTQKYELGSVPVVGYEMYSAGCTNSASIEYINSALKVTSDGPTVCTVYFR